MSINDIKYQALGEMGFTQGSLQDRETAFHREQASSTAPFSEAARDWLKVAGGSTSSQINDCWYNYLRGLGHTGSLTDMLYQFWSDPSDAGGPPVLQSESLIYSATGFTTLAATIAAVAPVGSRPILITSHQTFGSAGIVAPTWGGITFYKLNESLYFISSQQQRVTIWTADSVPASPSDIIISGSTTMSSASIAVTLLQFSNVDTIEVSGDVDNHISATSAQASPYTLTIDDVPESYKIAAFSNGKKELTLTSGGEILSSHFGAVDLAHIVATGAGPFVFGSTNPQRAVGAAVSLLSGNHYEDPLDYRLFLEGDSLMAGVDDFVVADAAVDVYTTALGSSTMSSIVTRITGATAKPYRPRTLVLWDGLPNGLTTIASYCDLIATALTKIRHSRYLIIPPIAPYGSTYQAGLQAYDVWVEMQSRWPDNILHWQDGLVNVDGNIDVSMFLSPPGDTIHINATASQLMSDLILSEISARGWE